MSEESRATLEIIAPSVEEAIEKGLAELGVSRNLVEIETLDEGSKGLFGLGGRQARIRLTLKAAGMPTRQPAAPPAKKAEPQPASKPEQESLAEEATPSDVENVSSIAAATVRELLEKMGIPKATVHAHLDEEASQDGRPGIVVEVLGDDLSILIGKQAETLNALQFITRLIVGKEVGHGFNLTVDVEGYRSRREQNLRQLARRMASQAIKTGRRQMLEPMPANERRVVHLELRENDEVSTESVGEEPRRKVVIIPNK